MVRKRIKTAAKERSIAGRAGMLLLAFAAFWLILQLEPVMDGDPSDGVVIAVGLLTFVLFFGGLYTIYAVIAVTVRGTDEEATEQPA